MKNIYLVAKVNQNGEVTFASINNMTEPFTQTFNLAEWFDDANEALDFLNRKGGHFIFKIVEDRL